MKKNIVIVILVVIILGMGGYLVYDKVLSNDETKNQSIEEKSTKKSEATNEEATEQDIILSLDSSKSLNTNNIEYSLAGYSGFDVSVSVAIDENNNKTFVVGYTKSLLDAYQIEGTENSNYFQKSIPYDADVVDIYGAGFGQAYGEETILFLKSDGTVDFMPVYYAIKNNDFRIYGKLDGVEKVIKFLSVGAHEKSGGSGWHTVLAVRADGTFYDLSSVIPKDQYYNRY